MSVSRKKALTFSSDLQIYSDPALVHTYPKY